MEDNDQHAVENDADGRHGPAEQPAAAAGPHPADGPAAGDVGEPMICEEQEYQHQDHEISAFDKLAIEHSALIEHNMEMQALLKQSQIQKQKLEQKITDLELRNFFAQSMEQINGTVSDIQQYSEKHGLPYSNVDIKRVTLTLGLKHPPDSLLKYLRGKTCVIVVECKDHGNNREPQDEPSTSQGGSVAKKLRLDTQPKQTEANIKPITAQKESDGMVVNEYCLRHIFKHVNYETLLTIQQVCTQWRRIAQESLEVFKLSTFQTNEKSVLVEVVQSTEYLGEFCSENMDLDSVLKSITDEMNHAMNWQAVIRTLVNAGGSIRTLDLVDCNPLHVAFLHALVQKIGVQMGVRCIRSGPWDFSQLQTRLSKMPVLKSLELVESDQQKLFSPKTIEYIVNHWLSQLTSLELVRSLPIFSKSYCQIISHLPVKLQKLFISASYVSGYIQQLLQRLQSGPPMTELKALFLEINYKDQHDADEVVVPDKPVQTVGRAMLEIADHIGSNVKTLGIKLVDKKLNVVEKRNLMTAISRFTEVEDLVLNVPCFKYCQDYKPILEKMTLLQKLTIISSTTVGAKLWAKTVNQLTLLNELQIPWHPVTVPFLNALNLPHLLKLVFLLHDLGSDVLPCSEKKAATLVEAFEGMGGRCWRLHTMSLPKIRGVSYPLPYGLHREMMKKRKELCQYHESVPVEDLRSVGGFHTLCLVCDKMVRGLEIEFTKASSVQSHKVKW